MIWYLEGRIRTWCRWMWCMCNQGKVWSLSLLLDSKWLVEMDEVFGQWWEEQREVGVDLEEREKNSQTFRSVSLQQREADYWWRWWQAFRFKVPHGGREGGEKVHVVEADGRPSEWSREEERRERRIMMMRTGAEIFKEFVSRKKDEERETEREREWEWYFSSLMSHSWDSGGETQRVRNKKLKTSPCSFCILTIYCCLSMADSNTPRNSSSQT